MDSHSYPLLILGGGYTGQIIYQQASLSERPVLISSREPDVRLTPIPLKHRLFFNLQEEKSWNLLPERADVIWTFPAIPFDWIMKFGKAKGIVFRRVIVLGSASSYQTNPQILDKVIDEKTPIDKTIPRVAGEEYLREVHGATLLMAAGIYGPGRNPLNWIRNGRIEDTQRFVNLIHVEDLAEICLKALEKGKPGEIYNVSDGTPRRWSEIIDAAEKRWGVPRPKPSPDLSPGKRISNHKMVRELNPLLRFPDLYTALEQIEAGQQ